MQTLPNNIQPIEEQIIEESIDKSPKEIAEKMSMPVKEVFEILANPVVKEFRDNRLAIMDNELQFRRVERASSLLDDLMDGIEELVKAGPRTWKMSHVKLFELLFKDLPNQIKNLKVNNVQVNNFESFQEEKEIENSLEETMSQLPASAKMEFWKEVDSLAKTYVEKYEVNGIQNVERSHDRS